MSQHRYLWKSAATGTWQCDMGLIAKPEMNILYGINPKAFYMPVNILQMKGTCGGTRGRSLDTFSSGINNH